MDTVILIVFLVVIYFLLDPGATLSFVTFWVAMIFDILPNVLLDFDVIFGMDWLHYSD